MAECPRRTIRVADDLWETLGAKTTTQSEPVVVTFTVTPTNGKVTRTDVAVAAFQSYVEET